MGEHTRNAVPAEKFQRGLHVLDGRMFELMANGFVHEVRPVRGKRVFDAEVVERIKESARQAGQSSSKIIRSGGLVVPSSQQPSPTPGA